MPSKRPVESHLPLKPVDFHILLVLTDGDLHGYGIVKEIESRSGGGIRLEPGNLYRYIRRLADEGMVEPADRRAVGAAGTSPGGRTGAEGDPGQEGGSDRSGQGSSERRRYYTVTEYGREVLVAEASRMRSLVAAADARLAPR
jgi:DNA-binding PadR family transcriptional regulator